MSATNPPPPGTAVLSVTAGAPQKAGKRSGTPRVGIDTTFGNRMHEAAAAYNGERWEEAISKATSALQMKPDGKNAAILYRIRGAAYEFLGDFSRALADYSEAIRSDPAVDLVDSYRASLYSRRGEFSKALTDLTVAIRKAPRQADIYSLRANLYVKMGRPEAARLDYQRVTRSPVKNGLEYALRAGAYFVIGQYAAASSDYVTAKRLKGDAEYVLSGATWFEATCPESRFRDGKTAVRDAARACERGKWKDPGDIDTLAAAYAEAGDFDRAISYESQAINLAGALPLEKRNLQAMRLFQERKPVREELKIN